MKQINIYLAGDSTVQTYTESHAPQAGWGQFFGEFFTEGVKIHNHAIGGRSSKTFIEEGRLDQIIREIQPGDYLFVQMGHNDSSKNRPKRFTKPYEDYQQYLKEYIIRAREKEANPLLITPVTRLNYENGKFLKDFEDYCCAMKQVAMEYQVPLIDLMEKSNEHLTEIGYEEAESYYMVSVLGDDYTHFTEKGARKMAQLVTKGIQEVLPQLGAFVK